MFYVRSKKEMDFEIGLTPVTATEFLQQEFPDIPHWTFIQMQTYPETPALARITGPGYTYSGRIGRWSWERVPTRYPSFALWNGHTKRLHAKKDYPDGLWTGVLRVRSPEGHEFLLFSYLDHHDSFCQHYLTSANDRALLRRFIRAAVRGLGIRKTKHARITVVNGPDIQINCEASGEEVFLPEAMMTDIDSQVDAFFNGRHIFKQLKARYQRGFLFVGPPGTGKTMMMRRIVRACHLKYKANFVSLTIGRKVDEGDLGRAFLMAEMESPAILLLEDMDSLTRETMVSRSAFLALLDGLNTNDGILIIGSSNNPEQVDPALVHRPSRFDRVWSFPVPDASLRKAYLSHHFATVPPAIIDSLVKQTGNWSFAYLNELRTTAAILANGKGLTDITPGILIEAAKALAAQFNAGRKNHASSPPELDIGFKVA